MTGTRVYIAGAGIFSPLGCGLAATEAALRGNISAIRPLDLFPLLHGLPLPVGQVCDEIGQSSLPRTHGLARVAALQAMAGGPPPDAVILGTTTGGILTTEQLLRDGENRKEAYRYHGLHSVAEYIAQETGCRGPALAVSTACSSGAVAITLALEMLRRGKVASVLAGGVDSLCRLTYFGFHSLQLVDRDGCRPLDMDRHGMAVAEGAAMLLLTTRRPDSPLAELLGAGLSCDAYHPAAPHPDGRGAGMAMRNALADAGIKTADIGYISLHGTGTPENDLAEAKAVRALFDTPPPLSSIKGATGHSLAAAGAIEAVVSAMVVAGNFLPANTGCLHPDPALGLVPLAAPVVARQTAAVLSNSFGFGGNNGCLVIAEPDRFACAGDDKASILAVHGWSCITGAGNTTATLSRLVRGESVAGMADGDSLTEKLPPGLVRRLKRLPRLALALALAAHEQSGLAGQPSTVFMGSGWGALSETCDFLNRLAESQEQFPSPTDFVGSVHNGPAGQVAIMCGATGANITVSGGDCSFEQALLAADLLLSEGDGCGLVLGADEGHQLLSPLLDPSIASGATLADGGGGLCLSRNHEGAHCCVRVPTIVTSNDASAIDTLLGTLGGAQTVQDRVALILAGIPAGAREQGEEQLACFVRRAGCSAPVIRYRELTGEFASASAVAAVMAVSLLASGRVPGVLLAGRELVFSAEKGSVLILGLGQGLSAMEFFRP